MYTSQHGVNMLLHHRSKHQDESIIVISTEETTYLIKTTGISTDISEKKNGSSLVSKHTEEYRSRRECNLPEHSHVVSISVGNLQVSAATNCFAL